MDRCTHVRLGGDRTQDAWVWMGVGVWVGVSRPWWRVCEPGVLAKHRVFSSYQLDQYDAMLILSRWNRLRMACGVRSAGVHFL